MKYTFFGPGHYKVSEKDVAVITDEGYKLYWHPLLNLHKEDGFLLYSNKEKELLLVYKVLNEKVVPFEFSRRKDGGFNSYGDGSLLVGIMDRELSLGFSSAGIPWSYFLDELLNPYLGTTLFYSNKMIKLIFDDLKESF